MVPLSTPPEGHHFRFEVDLDQCTGCKACVTACHNLNGLDVGESFRSVGLLVTAGTAVAVSTPAQQTVTTACHHCADPGCLNGCPAEAYEKDPVTGIVKHLDDACIGCRYCTLTCPYEVPVYNHRLGIVRKCDMCADRLSDGEAPACVQGCPTEAISITTTPIESAEVSPGEVLVPGAAPSVLTKPTTMYRGRALGGDLKPIDGGIVKAQHAHTPLVVLLVLSQASVGVIAGAFALALAGTDNALTLSAAVGALLAICSVVASVGHLGQPTKAWRVILGWSHSWLSREAIVLGGYLTVVLGSVGTLVIDRALGTALLGASVIIGVVAVFCSAMIYVVTGRTFWQLPQTAARFFGTIAIAGTGWVSFAALADGELAAARIATVALLGVLAAKLWVEWRVLAAKDPDLQRTATLLRGELHSLSRLRSGSAFVGAVLMTLGAFGAEQRPEQGAALVIVALVAVIVGEISERRLFFQACAPMTMPGAQR